VVDAGGQPLPGEFHVAVLGPWGPYPSSGSWESADASGRFRIRLIRGRRYRFIVPSGAGDRTTTLDILIDGSPLRLALAP
jgi:hypothetical protein